MGRDTLDRAVESALAQNLPPNEILVIAGKEAKPFIEERSASENN